MKIWNIQIYIAVNCYFLPLILISNVNKINNPFFLHKKATIWMENLTCWGSIQIVKLIGKYYKILRNLAPRINNSFLRIYCWNCQIHFLFQKFQSSPTTGEFSFEVNQQKIFTRFPMPSSGQCVISRWFNWTATPNEQYICCWNSFCMIKSKTNINIVNCCEARFWKNYCSVWYKFEVPNFCWCSFHVTQMILISSNLNTWLLTYMFFHDISNDWKERVPVFCFGRSNYCSLHCHLVWLEF